MNPVKLRELAALATEIPVSPEDAQILFTNRAWLARKQMLVSRLADSYNALVNESRNTEQVHVLRGVIMALEAVLGFEATIIDTAMTDVGIGKKETQQHARDQETFVAGLTDLLTGEDTHG